MNANRTPVIKEQPVLTRCVNASNNSTHLYVVITPPIAILPMTHYTNHSILVDDVDD